MAMIDMPRERGLAELTAAERKALTLWKWRYLLKTEGFTVAQADRLMFERWQAKQRPAVAR